MQKLYPDTYVIIDIPAASNPPAGKVWLWRNTAGWIEKRSDGTTAQFALNIEALVAPTITDLDKPWSVWFHYAWDMPNQKATVWEYKRSPISNDILPNPIPWEIPVPLTPRVNTDGTSTLTLPQGADFTYTPSRSAQLNQATFPAGVFNGISYQYMTATGTALKTGTVAHSVAPTATAAGLGIVAAPATAASVQITFAYISGGSLIYSYALP